VGRLHNCPNAPPFFDALLLRQYLINLSENCRVYREDIGLFNDITCIVVDGVEKKRIKHESKKSEHWDSFGSHGMRLSVRI
jgi:hypothetical protein